MFATSAKFKGQSTKDKVKTQKVKKISKVRLTYSKISYFSSTLILRLWTLHFLLYSLALVFFTLNFGH